MIIEVLSIVLSLGLLMFFAYRGYPVIVFAPIFTLLAVVLSGLALLPSYTETFMTNAANYVKSFFPIFLLGAIFGKVMELRFVYLRRNPSPKQDREALLLYTRVSSE